MFEIWIWELSAWATVPISIEMNGIHPQNIVEQQGDCTLWDFEKKWIK